MGPMVQPWSFKWSNRGHWIDFLEQPESQTIIRVPAYNTITPAVESLENIGKSL